MRFPIVVVIPIRDKRAVHLLLLLNHVFEGIIRVLTALFLP